MRQDRLVAQGRSIKYGRSGKRVTLQGLRFPVLVVTISSIMVNVKRALLCIAYRFLLFSLLAFVLSQWGTR